MTPQVVGKSDVSDPFAAFAALLCSACTNAKPRYFVCIGSEVDWSLGFATLQDAERFIEDSGKHFGNDWRVGRLWRVRTLKTDLRIVDKKLQSPKGSPKK